MAEESTNATQTQGVDSNGKTFTQDEVNRIVTERLDRERSKFADYEPIKSELATLKSSHNEINDKHSKLASKIDEYANSLLTDIEEDKKSLIPESLSGLDKLDYINKNKTILFTKKVALPTQTPTTSISDTNLIDGKWKNHDEYAKNDPKGYIAARKAGRI